MLLDILQ